MSSGYLKLVKNMIPMAILNIIVIGILGGVWLK